MTQAQEVDHSPLRAYWDSSLTRKPMDSKRVCEIIGQVAAEVLSEVQAGTWRPPTTLRINPQPHSVWIGEENF